MKIILSFALAVACIFASCKEDKITPELQNSSIVKNVSVYGGTDGAIDVTITGGQPPYTFKWSNGTTDEDITNAAAGVYELNLTDADGNNKDTSYTITSPDSISITKIVTLSGFEVNDGAIDITMTGGVAPYQYSWSNGAATEDLNGIKADLYVVTITDANGIQRVDSTQLPQVVDISLVATNESYNGIKDGKIVVDIFGGVEPYTISWSNGNTSKTNRSLIAGDYSCTVVDATGRSVSKSTTLTQIHTFEIPDTLNYIKVYKQSSLRIDDNGTVIYFDPTYVSGNGDDADIVFTSHSHGDHTGISGFGTSATKFVSPLDVKANYTNCSDANYYLAKEDTSFTIGSISVKVVAAYNSWHSRGFGVGYVITLSNGTVLYFMGDTDLIPEMSDIDCDIVFVPLGTTYTMGSLANAETAVQNCKAEIAIPIHGLNEGTTKNILQFYNDLTPKNIDVLVFPINE